MSPALGEELHLRSHGQGCHRDRYRNAAARRTGPACNRGDYIVYDQRQAGKVGGWRGLERRLDRPFGASDGRFKVKRGGEQIVAGTFRQ